MNARIAAAVAAALLCASAHADVVYNFRVTGGFTNDVYNRLPADRVLGRLVLDDAAWQSGRVQFNQSAQTPTPARTDSPIIELSFALSDLSATPRNPRDVAGVRADLSIDSTGALGGSISLVKLFADIDLSGSAAGWVINRYDQDPTAACGPLGTPGTCRGATGQWVLASQSSVPGQVPLPGTLTLMALASFGIAAAMRRRA